MRKSSCSARDCLGEPVDTPESDPPLEVESRSLLHGTDADRRIVTVEPSEEEREREHKTFSETLKNKDCSKFGWTREFVSSPGSRDGDIAGAERRVGDNVEQKR